MQNRHRITPPIRFWRTGAVAVVMAALAGARLEAAQEREMETRLSRYDVPQTAQRIEESARRRGLAVLASVLQPDGPAAADGQVLVLVLESPRGGTPVVMQGEGIEMRSELPLRLELRSRAGGASEVRFAARVGRAATELADELRADLAGLPTLVADALGERGAGLS